MANVSADKMSPFFPTMMAQLRCGLTHINEDIQLDSVKLLQVYMDQYSILLFSHIHKLVPLLTSLLSRQVSRKGVTHPGKLKGASVSSDMMLKLDTKLTIMELISRLLQLKLSHLRTFSSMNNCQDKVLSVDLCKQTVQSDLNESSEAQNSSCYFSNCTSYLSILHTNNNAVHGLSERPAVSSTFSESELEEFLDVLNVLVGLVMENWTEVASTPSQHVTMMGKLLKLLNIVLNLLNVLSISRSNCGLENKKWMNVYSTVKNGVSSYLFKQFPFFATKSGPKDQWSLLELRANFVFCNVIQILCVMGKLVKDEDNRLMEFISTVSEFLHTFSFHLLVANSSQSLSTITELTVEVLPDLCQLIDSGLDATVAKKIMGFIWSLYKDFCHPQSRSKQLLIKCLGSVFMREVTKGNIAKRYNYYL